MCLWGMPKDGEGAEEAGLASLPDQTVQIEDLKLPELPGVATLLRRWKQKLGSYIAWDDWNHFENVLKEQSVLSVFRRETEPNWGRSAVAGFRKREVRRTIYGENEPMAPPTPMAVVGIAECHDCVRLVGAAGLVQRTDKSAGEIL